MACIEERISYEFDTSYGGTPAIIPVGSGGTNYLISYSGNLNYGTLKHVVVVDDGSISTIDTLVHVSSVTSYHNIVALPTLDQGTTGLFFLITYINSDGHIQYKTILIDADDNTISELDSLESTFHPSYDCAFPHTAQISSDSSKFMTLYSVIESSTYLTLWLGRVVIGHTLSRLITNSLTQELVNTASNLCQYGKLTKIDDTHLLATYATQEDSAVIRARSYSHDSSLTVTNIDEENISTWSWPHDIIKVTSYYYLLAVRDTVLTFGVNSSTWAITSGISSLDYTTEIPETVSITQLSTYKFMIAYNDTTTNDGWVRVLNASTSYVMTDYASLEHEATFCNDSVVLGISSNSAILVYTGASYDGFAKTFGPCTSKISIDGEWRNIIGMQICITTSKVKSWETVEGSKISISSSWEDVLLAEDF